MKKAIAIFVVCCFVAAFADNPHITQLIELVDVAISSPADGDVLTFSASTGKWSNKQPIAPVIPDSANVVMVYQQENISGVFPQTAIFTPTETGLYRVNIYASPQANGGSASLNSGVTLLSNDGVAQNEMFARFGAGSGFAGEHTGTIKIGAGTSVLVSSAEPDSSLYSFYVVIEKL